MTNALIPDTLQEAVEREVDAPGIDLSEIVAKPHRITFAFPAMRESAPLLDSGCQVAGVVARRQQFIEGTVEVAAEESGDGMKESEWRLLEETPPLEHVRIFDMDLRPGDRVRLRPQRGGDIFDIALAGQTATIEAIEQDYEDRIHLAVILDDDPGRDLGQLRQPGHRFFFSPDEVEPLRPEEGRDGPMTRPYILIAGVGNIFLGDDAFGSEVARRLVGRMPPDEVRVVDFGVRGFDLACALMDGYEVTVLVDATPRGGAPGTLYVIEPDLSELDASNSQEMMMATHGMNPMRALGLVKAMGAEFKRILLVGCEPATFDADEERMGLSEPVRAAVDEAVDLVESLVSEIIGSRSNTVCETTAD